MKTYRETLTSKAKKRAIVHGVFAVIIMIIIFIFSSQKGYESSKLSDSVYNFLSRILSPITSEAFMTFLHDYIRKIAHVTMYFLLSLFTSLCSIAIYRCRMLKGRSENCTWVRAFFHYFARWAVAVLYAVTDEIHQVAVPGRSCEIADMGIDALSALAATLLVALFSIVRLKKTKKFIIEEEAPYNQETR